MIRTLALIVRRPDVSRADFREHYEDVHVRLALPNLAGLRHYQRNHVVGEPMGPVGFDAATEFGYASREAFEGIVAWLGGDAGEPIRRDELTFMDKPRNHFFAVVDRTSEERETLPKRGQKALVLTRRPDGETRADFQLRFAEETLTRLCAPGAAPLHVLHAETALYDVAAQWDCATWLWLPSAASLPDRLASPATDGSTRSLALVEACETARSEMPD